MTGEPAKTRRASLRRLPMQDLGGLALLLLGLLYAVGSLLTMADLNGANVSIRDALPLIPLEDLLARGIGAAAYLGVAVLWLLVFAFLHTRLSEDANPDSWAYTLLLLGVLAGTVLVAIAVVPTIMGLGILVGVAAFFGNRRKVGKVTELIPPMIPVVLALALQAYLAPQPLATATLPQDGSPPLVGLVIAVDDRWHLVDSSSRRILVAEQPKQVAELDPGRPSEWQEDLLSMLGWPWWISLLTALLGIVGVLGAAWLVEVTDPPPATGGPDSPSSTPD